MRAKRERFRDRVSYALTRYSNMLFTLLYKYVFLSGSVLL